MYADDTKIMRTVTCDADRQLLQQDIDAITNWTQTWRLYLNTKKCKYMHISSLQSEPRQYFMNESEPNGSNERIELELTTSERDLGVQISNDLKASAQATKASSKANSVLGMLKRSFVSRDSELWKRLYMIYVRPHLEYAVAAWNPYLKKDIAALERIQHRATKIPPSLKNLNYVQRCSALKLTTLEQRRVRGDLIQHFKISRDIDQVVWHSNQASVCTRDGHTKLIREKSKNCDQRFNFFTNRIVPNWHHLPNIVMQADTTNQFKERLDKWNEAGAVKRRRSRKSFHQHQPSSAVAPDRSLET